MSTWINSLTVALDSDMALEDVELIMVAIGQLRGVCAVTPTERRPEDFVARERVRHEMRTLIIEALDHHGPNR